MTISIDLKTPTSVHIVGIGGSGMSAIADVLIGMGHTVTGSDLTDSPATERLTDAEITVHIGHEPDHIGSAQLITHSTAIPADNVELRAAAAAGRPVLRRADIAALITRAWTTAAVAGTHGKTTTSAMLTAALRGAGLDPAFLVGGELRDLGRGAAVGQGSLLVVEADESDGTFVELDSHGIIVTNVEPDHLEYYGGFEQLRRAFVQFVCEATGPKVVCIDDPGGAELAEAVANRNIDVVTYGTSPEATWRITKALPTPTGVTAALTHGESTYELRLQQPGMHNVRNATGALALAVELGAEPALALAGLNNFGGVGRRFEPRGEYGSIRLVDDYAHLPTEVEAALAAAASLQPKRLIAVFQPHRFSRTEQLWSTFGGSFQQADILVITGIYPSGEKPRPGITGHLIVDVVSAAHPEADIRYRPSLPDVTTELVAELQAGDLCITLGAGDLTTICDDVLAGLKLRG